MTEPTSLERAVLLAVVDQLNSPEKENLARQVLNASVIRRENTGAGFYTHFDVGDGPYNHLPDLTDRMVEARVEGLQHGIGFILWVKNGRLDVLEGYSYEEVTTPLKWEGVAFELINLRKNYLS